MPAEGGYAESNLAAADTFFSGLTEAYSVSDPISSPSGYIYTGDHSLSLYQKWQNLSATALTAAKIPNLIWTDIMANAIIGTRSRISDDSLPNNIQPRLHARNDEPEHKVAKRDVLPISTGSFPVHLYRSQVTYRWVYAIPAILSLALVASILLIIVYLTVVGKIASPRMLRFYLHWTSAGRLLAVTRDLQAVAAIDESSSYEPDVSHSQPVPGVFRRGTVAIECEKDHKNIPSARWTKTAGRQTVDMAAVSETYASSNAFTEKASKIEYKSLPSSRITEQSSLTTESD